MSNTRLRSLRIGYLTPGRIGVSLWMDGFVRPCACADPATRLGQFLLSSCTSFERLNHCMRKQVRCSSGSDVMRSTGRGLLLRICTGTFGLLGGTSLFWLCCIIAISARTLMFHVGQVSGQRCSRPWEHVYHIPLTFPYSALYVSFIESHFLFGRVCRPLTARDTSTFCSCMRQQP